MVQVFIVTNADYFSESAFVFRRATNRKTVRQRFPFINIIIDRRNLITLGLIITEIPSIPDLDEIQEDNGLNNLKNVPS